MRSKARITSNRETRSGYNESNMHSPMSEDMGIVTLNALGICTAQMLQRVLLLLSSFPGVGPRLSELGVTRTGPLFLVLPLSAVRKSSWMICQQVRPYQGSPDTWHLITNPCSHGVRFPWWRNHTNMCIFSTKSPQPKFGRRILSYIHYTSPDSRVCFCV